MKIPHNVTAIVRVSIIRHTQEEGELVERTLSRAETMIEHEGTTDSKLGLALQSASYNTFTRALADAAIDKPKRSG